MTQMGFMHTWSNYYQDLPMTIPTFEKLLDPVPTIKRQFIYDTLTQVPQLGFHYRPKDCYEMFNEMHSTMSQVDIKLTHTKIMNIYSVAKQSTEKKISTVDSLTAYLVTVLNRIEDVPIRRIANIIGVRQT